MTTVEPKILFEHESQAHVMCGHCPATVSPPVADRSNAFKRRIYEFGPDTFAAIEYDGSSVMVVGSEGAVIVGALAHMQNGRDVDEQFKKARGDKSISAVIYNDSLSDNYGGVEAFLASNKSTDDVTVIAHETFVQIIKDIGDVGNMHLWRAAYQLGAFLEKGPEGYVHAGAVAYSMDKVSYLPPTLLVGDSWKGTLGGVKTEIYHLPAESDDGLVTYFPEQKTLVVGHVIFGDMLPMLYAQRGIVRNPKRWYKGIEALIDLVNSMDVEYMVPMHFFEPIYGRDKIMALLIANRDVLQFMSDQPARLINKGYCPDDLAEAIKLPPHLGEHPNLGEHYGRLQQHMRQQFVDQLGWFQGDPTFLDPLSGRARAKHYIGALGGREEILKKANDAAEKGENLWASELLTWLVLDNPKDQQARQDKADVLRKQGYAAPNATYRNWFLTSALEMEGKLPALQLNKGVVIPDKVLQSFSPIEQLETLKPRLIAENTFELEYKINIQFNDGADDVFLIIRRGILETRAGQLVDADALLRLSTSSLQELVENQKNLEAVLDAGELVIEQGEVKQLQEIETYFEPSSGGNYPVAMPIQI